MKKILKTFGLAAVLFSAVTFNLTALDSGLFNGTAGTVRDDVQNIMDPIEWNTVKFDNVFGFTRINSNQSGNLAAAFHVNGSDVLAIAWNGNLWADVPNNSFTCFYGWDKNGITVNYSQYKAHNTNNIDPNLGYTFDDDVNIFTFGAGYGRTINEKFAFAILLNDTMLNAKITTYDFSFSLFTGAADLFYTFKNDGKLNAKLVTGYAGIFMNAETNYGVTTVSADSSVNTIHAGVNLEYKPSSNFTYGLVADVPLAFMDGATVLAFSVKNGFSYAIQPGKFLLNMGLETTLPSITFPDGSDTTYGTFGNTFYGGLSFFASDAIRIDLSADLGLTNGISLYEIWTQNFNLSLRMSL